MLELPGLIRVFHPKLSLNTWMGFAQRWGGRRKLMATGVEWTIRLLIPSSLVGSGVVGGRVGVYLAGDDP